MIEHRHNQRDKRIKFMSLDRKADRDRIYRELHLLLIEHNEAVAIDDKESALRIVSHKLRELRSQ